VCLAFGAEQRAQRQPGKRSAHYVAAPHIRPAFGFPLPRKEAEPQAPVRAIADAVEAQVAFGLAPSGARNRIVASLAMQQAAIAVAALRRMLLESQDGPARRYPQQRAQRAKRPAPEPCDPQVGHHQPGQDQTKKNACWKCGARRLHRSSAGRTEAPSERTRIAIGSNASSQVTPYSAAPSSIESSQYLAACHGR